MAHQTQVYLIGDRWTWKCSCQMEGPSYDTREGAEEGAERHKTEGPF